MTRTATIAGLLRFASILAVLWIAPVLSAQDAPASAPAEAAAAQSAATQPAVTPTPAPQPVASAPVEPQAPASQPAASQPVASTSTSEPKPATETAPAPEPPAVAVAPAVDQKRLQDLLALIEGQNSLQVRRTGVRELLTQDWPEGCARLDAILRGSNGPARLAVALVLAETPQAISAELLDALVGVLSDGDAELRSAAVDALLAGHNAETITRLQAFLAKNDLPIFAYRAALETLGGMPRRAAAAALIEVLSGDRPELAVPALAALEELCGESFGGDVAAALRWWQQAAQDDSNAWYERQIDRLAERNRQIEQRTRGLEQRLVTVLREQYYRTEEAERLPLLNGHLSDASAAVRQLGLELVRSQIAERRTLPPETIERVRVLLEAGEAAVRAAAARTIAALRDPTDAERFVELLTRERDNTVREAVINGLGYVGDSATAVRLIELSRNGRPHNRSAIIGALGRLAERRVLDEPARHTVADELARQAGEIPASEHTLRERLLWAISRVADPRFGSVFVAALDTPEAPAVRLAAVRGIAVLADPKITAANGATTAPATQSAALGPALSRAQLLDALVPLAGDADLGVRRTVVETLEQFGFSSDQLAVLWSRSLPDRETDEAIRVAARRGVTRIFGTLSWENQSAWLDRVAREAPGATDRLVELLRVVEGQLAEAPDPSRVRGQVRLRLARIAAARNEIDPALQYYVDALPDLRGVDADAYQTAAGELLRFALQQNRFDERVATLLNQAEDALDGEALWQTVRSEIDARLQPAAAERLLAMVEALQAHPLVGLPAEGAGYLEEVARRAREQQQRVQAERQRAQIEAAFNAALERLRAAPDDADARRQLTELGEAAAPLLRARLSVVLAAESPDPAEERLLHDLLKALQPDWPGFAPDAPTADKLRVLSDGTA